MQSRVSHPRLCLAFASVFLAAASAHAQGSIPTPSQFLRFEVGADRQLADYKQISSYFRALADASPRMDLEVLGQTTLGVDMIMAVISSEENLRNKAKLKENATRLADPRGLSAPEVDALARDGKTILLVTCNIHATEIGASQMAMEWAHRLVTAQDAETRKRLGDVVLLLVPSLNPDGQTLVTEWYRKHLGTKYEGIRLPYLYHHYVGHDNNRDWYMLTQKETINMHRAVYHDWHPQIWLDEHQMGATGPRIYVPPNADPVAEKVHPLIHRGNNLVGMTMAWRLEEAKKSGVISGYSFDAYWPGGTRNTGWWRNAYGVLTEVASVRVATPIEVDPTELSGGAKGLIDYKQQINFPNPWPGGTWRLRDIIDYELIVSDAALETASKFGEALRRGVAQMAQDAVASGRDDEFWIIPTAQRNPVKATKLARLMQDHGLEVRLKADRSAYLLPTRHPFVKFADEMLDVQRYPEVRTQQGSGILAPYDVAAWTLPLLMGVEGVKREKLTADESRSTALTTPIEVPKQTISDIAKVKPAKPVRVGLHKPWTASMDEGWTRWVLEQYAVPFRNLDNKAIRDGNLNTSFDAIILPSQNKSFLLEGRPKDETAYFEELPPEYAGGIGKEGVRALRDFVEKGGTLIAFAESCDLVVEEFNLPVRNSLKGSKPDDINIPGSLLRIHLDPEHPVNAGMPGEAAAFVDAAMAFQTAAPPSDVKRAVLAWYPADERDILLSGWIKGAERLEKKAAAVAFEVGKGKIVLFGFRVQHRAQSEGTFPMLFNAIQWAGVEGGAPSAGR
jgi:hypothetical protein